MTRSQSKCHVLREDIARYYERRAKDGSSRDRYVPFLRLTVGAHPAFFYVAYADRDFSSKLKAALTRWEFLWWWGAISRA